MAEANEEQKLQLIARLAKDTNRKKWDGRKLQLILGLPATEFDGVFAALINSYQPPALPEPVQIVVTPPTDPLVLPKTFDPTQFISNGWTIWKGDPIGKGLQGDEEQDPRSLALMEVDFTIFTKGGNFLTGLEGSETVVTGEVKRARLIAKMIQADARIGQALFEEKGQTTLRWLYGTLKITWFELLGTTLRSSNGNRYALYLDRRDDGSWYWNCHWLGNSRYAYIPALSLASKS
jgi:hypothetical protein